MVGIFSVTEEDIKQLSPEDCVRLFGELLHADARRMKLSISKVHFTTKEIPDGGIDALVDRGLSESGDLIVDTESFYQIKAGERFSPWHKSEIEDELLKKDTKKVKLASEVKRCFDRNGTYILVCMKASITPKRKNEAETFLKKIFKRCGIPNPKVEVWGPEKIIGTIARFPSLALHLSGRDRTVFQSHEDWATGDDMQKPLVLGEKQKDFIKTIRGALIDDSEGIHVNVYGETGVGKTRLIFESTKDPFLKPLVIYIEHPKNFKDSYLMTEIIRDNTLHVVLVIDDCNFTDRTYIWEKLKNLGSRIKLVTICNEYVRTQGNTKQIEVPNLTNEKISEIIQLYCKDKIIAGQLAVFCDGLPLFAHAVGLDARYNPDEMLRGIPDTGSFFNRYLNLGDDPNSNWVKQRRRILLIISLFKKFGFGNNFKEEMNAVYKLIEKIDNSITLGIFHEHVKELRTKKILKGEDTLYITPRGFHIWLWMKQWEDFESLFDFEDFVRNLPLPLHAWFFDMWDYAPHSDAVRSRVTGLFHIDGLFSDSKSIQTELGSKFFQILASIDPKFATEYLEKTMGTWSPNDLENFHVGRREIIYGLERIVFESELFARGARLLRSLAEHENEQWVNNATGLFAGLFSLGLGYGSSTKAHPTTRLPLLKETLCSKNESMRNLGLKACESALQTMYFTHLSNPSGNELRIDQKGWEAKTYEELGDAYLQIIDVMIEKIKDFPQKDQKRGASIIFENTRGILCRLPHIAENIIDRLYEIKDFTDKEVVLHNIIDILELDEDQLSPIIKNRLKEFQTQIIGKDYSSRLKRCAGMDIMIDLAKKDRETWRLKHVQKLAEMSLDAKKLKPELAWLATDDAKYGYVFGQELAKKDKDFSLLTLLLDEQRKTGKKGSGFFLSGYLQVIFEKDNEKWLQIMKEISHDSRLTRFLIETACMSGITDDIGLWILDLVKSQKIKVNELERFVFGGVVNGLSEIVMVKWIEYMISTNDQKAIFSALSLYYSFFIHRGGKTLNPELTLKLLTHSVFMGKESKQAYNTMADYYWKETGLILIKQHPNESLEFADKILTSMGSAPIISLHSQSLEVLDTIASASPDGVWNLMTQYISLPYDERGFAIITWMRNGSSASNNFTSKINFQKISDWIDHDPHKLAPYIIGHVPPILDPDSLARKLLVRYGDEKSVQRTLAANFSTEGFSGSAVTHLQKKKKSLLEYKEKDDDKNVKNWIDFYVMQLDDDINHEKLSEEREL